MSIKTSVTITIDKETKIEIKTNIIKDENLGGENNKSEDEKIFCPWIKQDSKCKSLTGLLKFHYEILDFFHFIELNNEEKELRNKTYNFIKNIIDENFPDYFCELYGSFKTGLSLPNSDIDILILAKNEANNIDANTNNYKYLYNSLKQIYDKLKEKKDFSYLELIAAKVPIIKCKYKETNINVDISIFKKNGASAAEQLEKIINIHPEIRPLILVIKYMLRQRNLNEIYKGGASSFILFSLVYYYIIDVNKRVNDSINKGQNEKQLSLGNLLLGFFNFYGYDFNYKKLGISIRNGCFLYKRNGLTKNILSIENFQDITQDLGISCYQYNKVIDLFKYASKSISFSNSPVTSYLSNFILPDELLRERAIKVNKKK